MTHILTRVRLKINIHLLNQVHFTSERETIPARRHT